MMLVAKATAPADWEGTGWLAHPKQRRKVGHGRRSTFVLKKHPEAAGSGNCPWGERCGSSRGKYAV